MQFFVEVIGLMEKAKLESRNKEEELVKKGQELWRAKVTFR